MSANPQTADPSLARRLCTGGFRHLCIEAAFPQRFNPQIRSAGSSPAKQPGSPALATAVARTVSGARGAARRNSEAAARHRSAYPLASAHQSNRICFISSEAPLFLS